MVSARVFWLMVVMALWLTNCTSTPPPIPANTVVPTAQSTTVSAPQPYPYTSPLPAPTPTELDGIYTYAAKFIGTPTPCRRCAPYRAEGGTWTLEFDKGVFRVTHSDTDFLGIGSFIVDGDKLILFNDPHCHLETATYSWHRDGRVLRLTPIEDSCAFGLRSKNLGDESWLLQTNEAGNQLDPCQPPNREAAVTGHWPAPENCN